MATKVKILTPRTVCSGLGKFFYLALTAGLFFSGVRACERIETNAEYNSKLTKVSSLIDNNDVNSASNVLASYAQGKVLLPADQQELERKLQVTVKQIKFNQEKARIQSLSKNLDDLIASKKYSESLAFYTSLVQSNVLNSSAITNYSARINALAPQSILAMINSSSGRDKASKIEAFLSSPDGVPYASELKPLEVELHSKDILSHLSTDCPYDQTQESLNYFIKWAKKQEAKTISGLDFKTILEKGRNYLAFMPQEKSVFDIHIGDKVIVSKKMGLARGDQSNFYFAQDNNVLNKTGTVTGMGIDTLGKNTAQDSYRVWFSELNGDRLFVYNELVKENASPKTSIQNQLWEIKQLSGQN